MTKLFYSLAALLALAASSVSADFTKFDHEYDGRVMAVKWTMYTVEQLVEEQKDDWLSEQYNATDSGVDKACKDGSLTATVALQALSDFYAVADTKYQNFGQSAAAKIRGNPPDVSVVSIVAPRAWCDYIFGLMFAVAKESGKAELQTMLETAQKKAEEAIEKPLTPKEVNDIVVPLYGQGNKIYQSFSKELQNKIEDFANKWDDEVSSAVIKKSTVAPTTKGSTSESTTAAPGSAPTSGASRSILASAASVVAIVGVMAASMW